MFVPRCGSRRLAYQTSDTTVFALVGEGKASSRLFAKGVDHPFRSSPALVSRGAMASPSYLGHSLQLQYSNPREVFIGYCNVPYCALPTPSHLLPCINRLVC